jgi:hypothetical protein
MEEILNDKRYQLHLKRALLQAHLEMIDEAITQYNRYVCDSDLLYTGLRDSDERLYERYLSMIEGTE